ncbi:MAG TPA: helix-turn-helix domain-containing protein [Pyrinomonadaceae bacterium]|jgi:hypothetical protein
MSSKKITIIKNLDFVKRFEEVCGTSQPADVARFLNISYQTAKNYLQGRLPDSNVLRLISKRTPYSIHWLLTGHGEKFAEINKQEKDTDILSDALRAFIRRECAQVVGELLNNQKQPDAAISQPRIVLLTPDKIKEEKVSEESDVFSIKNS